MELLSYLELTYYGLPITIISVLIAVIYFLLNKFILKEKFVKYSRFIPFVLGILLYFLYEALFIKIRFSKETVSCGVLCGSLSLSVSYLLHKIKNGEKPDDLTFTTVEAIIVEVVNKENLKQTVNNVLQLEDYDEAVIENLIKQNAKTNVSENEIKTVAFIVFTTLKSKENE